ncbi:MAG: hypothetical protein IJ545_04170 [Alphaproteobacteria bacterium]|nr:hypothetical protein [Alphaproteobacteria bacterium]
MENAVNTEDLMQKINDYNDIIVNFSEVLKQENQALKEFDVAKVSSLFEQKSKLSLAYRSMVAFFIKHQEELKGLNEITRELLKKNSLELEKLFKENDLLLKTRMEASRTVVGAIVDATKMAVEAQATSYGARGTYAPIGSRNSAMAVNRTL